WLRLTLGARRDGARAGGRTGGPQRPTVPAMCPPAARPRHGGDGAVGVVTGADLERAAGELAAGVRPWEAGGFAHLRSLQAAPRNHGRVDAMCRGQDGAPAAVKRMPNWWVLGSLGEFQQGHPREEEQPWLDIAMLSELSRRGFPYVCDFLGVFRDGEWTYVATRPAGAQLWHRHRPSPNLHATR
ncbi:unnamed protein product, partial [Prorocentrum cordatum]